MKDVRKKLVEEKLVPWAYRCVTHCLNMFFEDVAKDLFVQVIKEAMCIVKNVRCSNLVLNMCDALCSEKVGRVYGNLLY